MPPFGTGDDLQRLVIILSQERDCPDQSDPNAVDDEQHRPGGSHPIHPQILRRAQEIDDEQRHDPNREHADVRRQELDAPEPCQEAGNTSLIRLAGANRGSVPLERFKWASWCFSLHVTCQSRTISGEQRKLKHLTAALFPLAVGCRAANGFAPVAGYRWPPAPGRDPESTCPPRSRLPNRCHRLP